MCGIWGIVNTRPRKFDYTTFCTLGIANDTRGGDSCGYFIDGNYEYGTKTVNKWFQYFFVKNKFLNTVNKSTIAFGHCRKASVGAINEATAQPVVISNKDGKVEYVLMHNGTIYNYEELAKKYIPNIDIKGLTDSQVMANIFYYSGYESLNEYVGGAVFAIIDYRYESPKVLLFKGASKKLQYDKEASEERPLYCCIDSEKEELVFSSISSYLYALRPELNVIDINTNCIFEFKGRKLIPIKSISRDNIVREKPLTSIINSFNWQNIDDYNYFISLNYTNNTYSSNCKKLHGKIILTEYGMILNESSNYSKCREIYFWNGVALKNSVCYKFLSVLKKEYKDKNFDKKFNNLIRYFSIDGIYESNGIWYKAISPFDSVLFTGQLSMLTSTSTVNFLEGFKRSTIYSKGCIMGFSSLNDSKIDYDFKKIKEECKSLMK